MKGKQKTCIMVQSDRFGLLSYDGTKVLYSRTQLVDVSDDVNILKLRLRVRLIGNEKR